MESIAVKVCKEFIRAPDTKAVQRGPRVSWVNVQNAKSVQWHRGSFHPKAIPGAGLEGSYGHMLQGVHSST